MLKIKNGLIHDAIHPEAFTADILVEEGKIKAIGDFAEVECETIDACGMHIYPGFIDAHSHIGMEESGIGFEGNDVNEFNDILCPQLRAIDAIQPIDPAFDEALRAGVTTVCTGPGSANVLGGQFVTMKTKGIRIDNMIVRQNSAMKCAFGENPKRCYRDKGSGSRMSVAAKLREALFKAKEYDEKCKLAENDPVKKPAFDFKMEALRPVLHGEIPLKAHAHRADDFFTAIRIAKEFGVKLTLEHVTEGHLVAEELAKEGYPLAVGPSLTHATKFELRNKTFATPGILAKAGLDVSIITDSPVIPQCYLPLCAALAMKSGMDEFDALRAITINPARHIGEGDRLGSIEIGKDADLLLMKEEWYKLDSAPAVVLMDGKVVVDER
ncbi:MAG: amidohydrolase [Clostridia bacterium]|nr:amidohydrolase [Clostridia bacterium]